MKSPCLGCRHELADKNNSTCVRCAKRVAYVHGLGPMSENVPIDQTNITGGGMGRWKKMSEEEMAIVRQGMRDRMTTVALAQKMGRNINTIYTAVKKIKAAEESRQDAVPAKESRLEAAPAGEAQRRLPFAGETVPPARALDQVFAGVPMLYGKLKLLALSQYRGLEEQVFYLVARAVRYHEDNFGTLKLPDEPRPAAAGPAAPPPEK